ncbi:MAG: ABC transporter ATP-binding protein [Bacteroidota bacterium]
MQITLSKVSKRYRYEWIFKKINYTFESGQAYAITGPNGSGKSTLMRVLSGYLSATKGQVDFRVDEQSIKAEEVYQYVNYAAPYIDLIEEFTLREQIQFHQRFRPLLDDVNIDQIINLLAFKKSKQKAIKDFSSGMKQRVKLALAMCTSGSLILLDEPTTNLDRQGVAWYLDLVKQFRQNRTIIVASNVEEDYPFATDILDILDYK